MIFQFYGVGTQDGRWAVRLFKISYPDANSNMDPDQALAPTLNCSLPQPRSVPAALRGTSPLLSWLPRPCVLHERGPDLSVPASRLWQCRQTLRSSNSRCSVADHGRLHFPNVVSMLGNVCAPALKFCGRLWARNIQASKMTYPGHAPIQICLGTIPARYLLHVA